MPSSTRTRRTAAMLLLAAALALALPSPAAGAPAAGAAAVCATADRLTASGDPGAAIATITDLREATPAAERRGPGVRCGVCERRPASGRRLGPRGLGEAAGRRRARDLRAQAGAAGVRRLPALAPGAGPTSEATSALVRSAVQAALVCDGSNATALALQEELGTSAAQVAESDVDRLPGGLGRPGARAGRRRPGVARDRARRGPAPARSPRQPGRRPARDRAEPAGALPGRRAGGPGAQLRVGRGAAVVDGPQLRRLAGRARAPTSGSWPSWGRPPCCWRWAGEGRWAPTPRWPSPAPSWPWSPLSAWWPRVGLLSPFEVSWRAAGLDPGPGPGGRARALRSRPPRPGLELPRSADHHLHRGRRPLPRAPAVPGPGPGPAHPGRHRGAAGHRRRDARRRRDRRELVDPVDRRPGPRPPPAEAADAVASERHRGRRPHGGRAGAQLSRHRHPDHRPGRHARVPPGGRDHRCRRRRRRPHGRSRPGGLPRRHGRHPDRPGPRHHPGPGRRHRGAQRRAARPGRPGAAGLHDRAGPLRRGGGARSRQPAGARRLLAQPLPRGLLRRGAPRLPPPARPRARERRRTPRADAAAAAAPHPGVRRRQPRLAAARRP